MWNDSLKENRISIPLTTKSRQTIISLTTADNRSALFITVYMSKWSFRMATQIFQNFQGRIRSTACRHTFVSWLLNSCKVSVLFVKSTLRKCVCTAFQLTIDLFTCFLIESIVHTGLYPVWTLRLLGTTKKNTHCFNYPIGNPRGQEPLLL